MGLQTSNHTPNNAKVAGWTPARATIKISCIQGFIWSFLSGWSRFYRRSGYRCTWLLLVHISLSVDA